ncbi:MAG: type I restriction endonuclease subunit R, partial [Gammaproteobacteria bacterium]
CGQFVKLFTGLNEYLEAAKIQGFTWSKLVYAFDFDKDSHGKGKNKTQVTLGFDETIYLTLVLRYKELSGGGGGGDVPFELSGHLTEIDTGKIDADYMNSRFEKYLTIVGQGDVNSEAIQKTVDELHKSFATLTQEEQKIANLFLNDVQRGDVIPEAGKTFRQYITEYQASAKNTQVTDLVNVLSKADAEDIATFNAKLSSMMNTGLTDANINEFGRFDDLKSCVDNAKAKAYFEELESASISPFKVNMKVDKLLQNFIISGGFDL